MKTELKVKIGIDEKLCSFPVSPEVLKKELEEYLSKWWIAKMGNSEISVQPIRPKN